MRGRRSRRRRHPAVPLGLYLHIPFCRKRCHFCYFRVYTDKNAQEVGQYLDVLAREWELYGQLPAIAGRPLNFVYFGGGTPSFLSTQQLQSLVGRLTAVTPWTRRRRNHVRVRAGHAHRAKLAAIRRMGVTRLSLGVENFDDRILEINGRAHRSPEIAQAYRAARALDFPADQHRPHRRHARRDRGELARLRREDAGARAGQRHHLPDGAALQHHDQQGPPEGHAAVRRAGRELVDEAALGAGGVRGARAGGLPRAAAPTPRSRIRRERSSSIAIASGRAPTWSGLGVASFGHVNGVHMQNLDTWETYSEAVDARRAPAAPRLPADARGADDPRAGAAAQAADSVRPRTSGTSTASTSSSASPRSSTACGTKATWRASEQRVALTRNGLLRVDVLLPRFFLPQHAGIRYT